MKIMKFLLSGVLVNSLCLVCLQSAAADKDAGDKEIRLIDYNILNGMWYDQYNGYDRFVSWVRSKDPDVLTLCESATHWDKDKVDRTPEEMPRFLPDSLGVLAARWGHRYYAVGPYQDNYPVSVTSKYPVEVIQRIGDGLSHGAMHVRIRGVNYVVLHLWPQKYSMGDTTRKDNKGDEFRVHEIRTILDSTICNPRFKDEKYWIMTGDFNSHSPLDEEYYGTSRNYDVHKMIREYYGHDVIGDIYKTFVPSMNNGKSRIDYIYCTPGIFENVKGAETVTDDFTEAASDHLPLLVDFIEPRSLSE